MASSFIGSIFGDTPTIADYTPTEFQAEVPKALGIDLANWEDISKIGSLFQDYLLSGYQRAGLDISGILRGGSDMVKSMEETGKAFLEGKIPEDVAAQVQRSSAFQNLLSGGGGGMANANVARNYGLTSLDLINKGATLAGQAGNAAQQWANLTGAGQAANVMSGMLITPQQQAALTMQNNLYKQATQQTKNNAAAAPNSGLQALNQWIEQVGGTIISAYATGGLSKGGDYKTKATDWGSNVAQGIGATGGAGNYAFANTPGIAPTSFNDTMPLPVSDTTGFYNGYGGVSPNYYGIANNPFNNAPTNFWDTAAYGSNFPTGG